MGQSTECEVLPGIFGILVQGVLFACCCGILILKKSRDRHRSWLEFLLDSSKQLIGAGWIHVMNLIFAEQLEAWIAKGDQCEWYWVNIMVDTTLGVGVEYFLLHLLSMLLELLLDKAAEDFQSGSYNYNPVTRDFDKAKYFKQLFVWLLVVTGMKGAMLILMIVAAIPLQAFAHAFLGIFMFSNEAKLVVVMIITPFIMNSFQFWVVDNIIKKQEDDKEADDEL